MGEYVHVSKGASRNVALGFPCNWSYLIITCQTWMMGIELRSPERASHALSHYAISSVPCNCKFLICLHRGIDVGTMKEEMGPERYVSFYEYLLYKPEDWTSDNSIQIIQHINFYNSSSKGCDELF